MNLSNIHTDNEGEELNSNSSVAKNDESSFDSPKQKKYKPAKSRKKGKKETQQKK